MAEKVQPYQYPFAMPENREDITHEPERYGTRQDPRFPDVEWIGTPNQGGGHVPEDYVWPTNPKQDQEEGSHG